MAPRRRVSQADGRRAVTAWLGGDEHAPVVATAVRYTLEELAADAPGNAVEVRVPPHGVTQCLEGPRHTRGTPPAVVEMSPHVWLSLATGKMSWPEAVAGSAVVASGERADLTDLLPLPGVPDDGAAAQSR